MRICSSFCKPWRSSFNRVLPNRFLPAHVPFNQDAVGVIVGNSSSDGRFLSLARRLALSKLCSNAKWGEQPFDSFCPTVKQIDKLVCDKCHVYFPTDAARKRYKNACNNTAGHQSNNCNDSESDSTDDDESATEQLNIEQFELESSDNIMSQQDLAEFSQAIKDAADFGETAKLPEDECEIDLC